MMMMRMMVSLCVIYNGLVDGYKSGAPEEVCGDMTPQHRTDPQKSESPFDISVGSKKIQPGQKVDVTLSAPEGLSFKGFLVEGWRFDEDKPVGSFNKGDTWRTLDCLSLTSSGITHVNNQPKTKLTAKWTSPTDFEGKLKFRATFVETGRKFWVNQTTDEIEVSGTPIEEVVEVIPNPFEHVYTGCYETKGCFGGPDGCVTSRNCKHMVTYIAMNDSVVFEMVGETRGWIGVGFSEDSLMGSDAVTSCTLNGSNDRVSVFQSWNKPNTKDNVALPVLQQGLSNITTTFQDGFLYCQFTHEAHYIVLDEFQFNLINESYFLFLGRGYMENLSHPRMQQHVALPYTSAVQASLTDVSELGVASDLLIKLHGSLMIVAWIGTVSIAIFLARYYKQMWPGSKHCGEKVWFSWHRMLNILTLLLTVTAFVLIFVQIKGWSQVWEQNPHPILGVVTTALVIVQPIMAAFRCHPGTPKRPVFNWLHFLVGNSAHILAVITLFFAKPLQKAKLPEMYMWVLIGYVAYHVVVFFIMEAFTCFHGKKVRENQIALKEFGASNGNAFSTNESQDSLGSRFRQSMLFLYIFGNVVFVIALVIIVAMSPVKER